MCLSPLKNVWRLPIFNKVVDITVCYIYMDWIVLYLCGRDIWAIWTLSEGILLVMKVFISVFFRKTPWKYAKTKYLV